MGEGIETGADRAVDFNRPDPDDKTAEQLGVDTGIDLHILALARLQLGGKRLELGGGERVGAGDLRRDLAARGLALQASGLGSLMTLHPTRRPLRNAADLAGCDGRVRDLLYFALLERGVFMARRGMTALSLPFGDALLKPLRGGETLNWKLQ